jgi:hypothetical protein
MVKVQFRDASDRSMVYIDEIYLPFDPRLEKRVRIRKRRYDAKHDTYQVIDFDSDVILDDPTESKIVMYVTPIRG